MNNSPQPPNYHLFVLKVWRAEAGADETEWRGQIQHIASREIRYFREWNLLLEFVQTQLQAVRENDFLLSQNNSDSE
jgi:hypothetical protein